MAKNASLNEKTLKSMMQMLQSDNWIIDRTLLYGNYNNKANLVIGTILDNYRDYFDQFLETAEVPEKYFYQPAAFAEFYYGTPDLDFLVMYFARIPTMFEFKRKKIKILPKAYLSDINKLMVKYKETIEKNYENPAEYVEMAELETQKKYYS